MADLTRHLDKAYETKDFDELADAPVDALEGLSKGDAEALVQAAHGAARTKQAGRTSLARRYRQLVVRRGKQRAAVAVGHQILVTAYHLLRRREDYTEVTPAALDERRRARARLRAVAQLRQLGFEVTLTPKEAAA